jgi:uncharacterized protein (TIGR02421 family)
MSAPHSTRPWRSYKERVASLAQRVVDAQRPIVVLNSLKWPQATFQEFSRGKYRTPPTITPEDYRAIPLGLNPEAKRAEFREIEADARRHLGAGDPIGAILIETARQYAQITEMLEARGTQAFYGFSRALYGSAKELLADGETKVVSVARDMYQILTQLDDSLLGPVAERNITAQTAVETLNQRLMGFFGEGTVSVILDDGIVADAAAGSSYIKIREGATFNERDLKILEVHEGWAHVATSLNGQDQPVARWLAIGPPRVTATQEGLAALLEVLTLASYPKRSQKLNHRVLAVDKAEDGADFMDVFEWFRTEGYEAEECYSNTHRVFRGGTLTGGAPFTKDIAYTKGVVSNYNFLTSAIAAGRPEYARWLFAGKVALEDIPVLAAKAHEGLVRPPRHLPHMFQDLNGIAIWLGISAFWGNLRRAPMQKHFQKLMDVSYPEPPAASEVSAPVPAAPPRH